jgi:hypothetical protein
MTEYSKEMVTCMGALSQLSPMELVDLAEAIEKEREARADRRCKEKILAAMKALDELYEYYYYLEIENENVMTNIYITDISKALKQLYALY